MKLDIRQREMIAEYVRARLYDAYEKEKRK